MSDKPTQQSAFEASVDRKGVKPSKAERGKADHDHDEDAAQETEGQTHDTDTADTEADDKARADEEAARKTEADKARRAEAGTTAAANGDPAGVAFAQRIADVKFELRNQGHSNAETLIDDLYAGIQRLEAKTGGNA
jgi:hypothetical protein